MRRLATGLLISTIGLGLGCQIDTDNSYEDTFAPVATEEKVEPTPAEKLEEKRSKESVKKEDGSVMFINTKEEYTIDDIAESSIIDLPGAKLNGFTIDNVDYLWWMTTDPTGHRRYQMVEFQLAEGPTLLLLPNVKHLNPQTRYDISYKRLHEDVKLDKYLFTRIFINTIYTCLDNQPMDESIKGIVTSIKPVEGLK